MSKEFIERRTGKYLLEEAKHQQDQLAYFTTSKIQENVTEQMMKAWAQRKYITNDHFLNWIKTIFKTGHFLSFYKYFRNPNPAAKLINTRIKEPLSRVFYAEDSYFNYILRGKQTVCPEELEDNFEKELFEKLIYRHNDILIHDLKDVNIPFREFINIEDVIAIESKHNRIQRIAYSAFAVVEEIEYKGYVFLDDISYKFYSTDYTMLIDEPHDLGYCPATFLTHENFSDNEIVKKSMFSYLRSDLEEYVFLKTLQKMTEPNGAIPIITQLDTKKKSSNNTKAGSPKQPVASNIMGNKSSDEARESVGSQTTEGTIMQAGTVITVPVMKDAHGKINTDLVKNLVDFHYIPIEALEYLKSRILEIEQNIIISILGDYSEANESAKNELQVSKSYVSKEDKLRWLGSVMSKTRSLSDRTMLGLKYGIDSIEANIFYGSDFFLESQKELYEMFQKSPNNIERKNILSRLAKSRNRDNKEKSDRESILYKILPYASDTEFSMSVSQNMVDPVTFQLQVRFDYWVAMWEAKYGSVVSFWEDKNLSDSEKLVLLNNLISEMIESNINLNKIQDGKEEPENS